MSETHKKRPSTFEVPKWVPAGLVSTYAEKAKATCEEDAASYVRQLKRRAPMFIKGEIKCDSQP